MKPRALHIFNQAKYVVLGILALLLIGVLIYLGYEFITLIQKQSDDTFGRVRAILLTLAAVVGLPFLIWRTWIADRQNQINKESQYTELFTKSVELLGTTRIGENGKSVPVPEARIGAIFALERLAKTSRIDYGPTIETLSAYIRDQCGTPSTFTFNQDDPDEEGIAIEEKSKRLRAWNKALREWVNEIRNNSPANRADIAAALRVLARRKEGRHWSMQSSQDEIVPDFSGTNLQGANLEAIMPALFEDVTGSHTPSVQGAILDGMHLEDSPLTRPIIQLELTASRIAPGSLTGVTVVGLRLVDAKWFPVFNGADLSLANMDNAQCRKAHFRGARLVNAHFRYAVLTESRFGVANASYASFDGAVLREVEFMNALLKSAKFVGADLSGAVFQYAVLDEANLEGSLLLGTDFRNARYLKTEMLESAFGTVDTKLPVGMRLPSHWTDEASAVAGWKAFRARAGMPED